MKFAKVITASTYENEQGLTMNFVTTVDAKTVPEKVFASMGLLGRIKSYNVTPDMPFGIALEYSFQLQRKMGIIR